MKRRVFAWLWDNDTLSDATLNLCVANKSIDAPFSASLPVHCALLAAHSEYFKARLLRWPSSGSQCAASFQASTVVAHFAKTGSLPSGLNASQLAQACKEAKAQDDLRCAEACSQALVDQVVEQPEPSHLPTPCLEETFDSQAECDAARLVVRCMYEGELAEEVKDPLTLARVCRVAERWASSSTSSLCLQRLIDLPPLLLPAEQLVLVLQTLPDSCALLPKHKKWQQRVHSLAGELNDLPILLHLYGDVHAVITSTQLRGHFRRLPFAAVEQWAGSDALTVDSENSVVELISLWMAGPGGRACSKEKQQLSCLVRVQHLSPAYALGRLPALDWFDIPGELTVVIAQAASCGCVVGVLRHAPPAWFAAHRKKLKPAELLRRTTIRWDVPRQQLVDLLASEDPTGDFYYSVSSELIYSAGAGWRVSLALSMGTEDEPGFTLGCWGELVTYAECEGHALGAPLPHGTHLKYTINKGTKLGHEWLNEWVQKGGGMDHWGYPSFLDKSLATAADLDPFLKDGCLQITAAFQTLVLGLVCACAAYALGRLPALDWFDIPGASTALMAQAACCGFGMTGVVLNTNEAPPTWSAAPRKQLDPDELLHRSTIC
ncbi:hypothetical protein QJQ45_012428 [Haematococcus lacustris]|nr:hypothetical protein QJQ45_012428 [Haematococcus lacustris]